MVKSPVIFKAPIKLAFVSVSILLSILYAISPEVFVADVLILVDVTTTLLILNGYVISSPLRAKGVSKLDINRLSSSPPKIFCSLASAVGAFVGSTVGAFVDSASIFFSSVIIISFGKITFSSV